MIGISLKKSKDVEDYYEFCVYVDTGTTVTSVDLGLAHPHEVEDELLTVIQNAQEALEKLYRKETQI